MRFDPPSAESPSAPDPYSDPHSASDFERRFVDVLGEVAGAVHPDLGPLTRDAVAHGRSRRRRRRAGLLAAAGACVAVAATAVVLPLAASGSGGAVRVAAAHSGTARPSARPVARITGAQMVAALEHALPSGPVSHASGQANGPDSGMVANAGAVYGKGQVGVSLEQLALPLGEDGTDVSCAGPVQSLRTGCVQRDLPAGGDYPGGAVLVVQQFRMGNVPAAHGHGVEEWTATLTVKGTGAQLRFVEWNTSAPGGSGAQAQVTRATPPLDLARAEALVRDHVWAPLLRVYDRPQADPSTPLAWSYPTGDRAGTTLASVLAAVAPHTATSSVTSSGSADAVAVFPAPDGSPLSYLTVNVRRLRTDAGSPAERQAAQAYLAGIRRDEQAVRLDDGSYLVDEAPVAAVGGNPAQHQPVELQLLRPDGTVVTVHQSAGPAGSPAATPLTSLQLRQLADAPAWPGLLGG